MACTALNIPNGSFSPTNWSTASSGGGGGINVTLTNDMGQMTISWSGPNGSDNLTGAAGDLLKYIFWDKFLVVLQTKIPVAGLADHAVLLVDFVAPSNTTVSLTGGFVTSTSASPLPHVAIRGDAFLFFVNTPSGINSVEILRGDNGDVLLSQVGPGVTTDAMTASATSTELQIKKAGAIYITGPRPAGELDVVTGPQTFTDVVVGGTCPQAASTKQFKLKNKGTDCLTIGAIANNAPFSVTPAFMATTLKVNEELTVTVTFAPTSTGNFNNKDLTITRSPANGDDRLRCSGEGVAAQTKIGFNPASKNVDFGTIPVGTTKNATLTLTNTWNNPVTGISFNLTPGGSPYTFSPALSSIASLACGASTAITITYSATAEGSQNAQLVVTSNANSSPDTVNLNGTGCIARAQIQVPGAFPAYGDVEKGFRVVRYFEVSNPGNGQLTFTASISGPDAALFGLMDTSNSITATVSTRSYAVNPVTPCGGSAGSGKTQVAVVFFANDTPPKSATATLTINNHNATQGSPPASFTFPLTGNITPPIPVDAVCVIDRSGSMADPASGGTKTQVAVQAAKVFAQLIPPTGDHRFAAVRFNEQGDAFIPMDFVTTGNQTNIVNGINTTALAPTTNTSIAAGAGTGLAEIAKLRTTIPPQLRKAMVVLSDGLDNTAWKNPADNKFYNILGGSAFNPNPAGIPPSVPCIALPLPADVQIYTIGLGVGADIDTASLNHLATVTQAAYQGFNPSDQALLYQLMKYFTGVYMDVVNMVPIQDPVVEIQPGQEYRFPFEVLNGDVGGLVVIYDIEGIRLPFWLETPKGEILDANFLPPGFKLRPGFTPATRFLQFENPPMEPDRYSGTWNLVVQHQKKLCRGNPVMWGQQGNDVRVGLGFTSGNCKTVLNKSVKFGFMIGVGSNFRMQAFVSPQTIYVGDPIWLDAVVTEAGLPVTGCTVTVDATAPNGTTFPTMKLHDDGAHNDVDPDDGEYANNFIHTAQPGAYTFLFRATGYSRDGQPVFRELTRGKYVWPKNGHPNDPGSPAGGNPGGGRPGGDGGKDDECCKRLVGEIRRQTKLLEELLNRNPPKARSRVPPIKRPKPKPPERPKPDTPDGGTRSLRRRR